MTTKLATDRLLPVHLWSPECVQSCPTQEVCAASSLPCSVGSSSLLFLTGGQLCAPTTFKSILGLGDSLILRLGVTAVSSWETDNPGFGAPWLSGSRSRHPQFTRKGWVQVSSHSPLPSPAQGIGGPRWSSPFRGQPHQPSNLPLPARTEACASARVEL